MTKNHAEHRSRFLCCAAVCLAVTAAMALRAQTTPDLSGVWRRRSSRAHYSEVWTIKQTPRDIRIRMDIKDDQLGDRARTWPAALLVCALGLSMVSYPPPSERR